MNSISHKHHLSAFFSFSNQVFFSNQCKYHRKIGKSLSLCFYFLSFFYVKFYSSFFCTQKTAFKVYPFYFVWFLLCKFHTFSHTLKHWTQWVKRRTQWVKHFIYFIFICFYQTVKHWTQWVKRRILSFAEAIVDSWSKYQFSKMHGCLYEHWR